MLASPICIYFALFNTKSDGVLISEHHGSCQFLKRPPLLLQKVVEADLVRCVHVLSPFAFELNGCVF
jgi:hypothetical protein